MHKSHDLTITLSLVCPANEVLLISGHPGNMKLGVRRSAHKAFCSKSLANVFWGMAGQIAVGIL